MPTGKHGFWRSLSKHGYGRPGGQWHPGAAFRSPKGSGHLACRESRLNHHKAADTDELLTVRVLMTTREMDFQK